MDETWKPIESMNGKYEVSDLGNVRNEKTKRLIARSSYSYMNGGKPFVILQDHGERCAVFVARLVAEHFIENPLGHLYIKYKDGDINNCRVDNLEWVQCRIDRQEGAFSQRAIRCHCAELNRTFDSISDAAEHFGVSVTCVANAIKYGRKIRKTFTIVPIEKKE